MACASYRAGVAWIARNDEAGDPDARDVACVSELVSCALLAGLFVRPTARYDRRHIAGRHRRAVVHADRTAVAIDHPRGKTAAVARA